MERSSTTEVSGRVRQSRAVQRGWPIAAAAGVLVAGAGALAVWQWKKQA
jgi:hypothetical protein